MYKMLNIYHTIITVIVKFLWDCLSTIRLVILWNKKTNYAMNVAAETLIYFGFKLSSFTQVMWEIHVITFNAIISLVKNLNV